MFVMSWGRLWKVECERLKVELNKTKIKNKFPLVYSDQFSTPKRLDKEAMSKTTLLEAFES